MKIANLFVVLLGSAIAFSSGCGKSNPSETGLEITLSSDSTSVQLTKISEVIIEELKKDTLDQEQWNNLLAVYTEPYDGLAAPLDGTYSFSDSKIIFTPSTRFEKGKTYKVESYIKRLHFEPEQIITGSRSPFKQEMIEKRFSF